eukprot:CAMPEP_0203891250 /NCGR_PEP_ID=MMETSP0359-20131031/34569_1 /ASSEMBLY_ACC=CAM_ASM_000338 /TAXON_ID=268821 /ORGANISM="Scrippsiella Hangoei, Strain SHTV-5" /LENGTH=57 /DNA_ID=CAMNT_0050813001 /DNA_START=30 /DNA_END=199 /DNA_ORIENTATION=+
MPEDEQQIILHALSEANESRMVGSTRYKCPCGYLYIVTDCGDAQAEGSCPECRRMIG